MIGECGGCTSILNGDKGWSNIAAFYQAFTTWIRWRRLQSELLARGDQRLNHIRSLWSDTTALQVNLYTFWQALTDVYIAQGNLKMVFRLCVRALVAARHALEPNFNADTTAGLGAEQHSISGVEWLPGGRDHGDPDLQAVRNWTSIFVLLHSPVVILSALRKPTV